MPKFVDKISYLDTTGVDVNLNQIQGVATVDESTLSVASAEEAQHAVNADHATNADNATNVRAKSGSYKTMANALLEMVYPVGSIYISTSSTSPQSFLGGTWSRFANGQVLVGVNESDSDFATVQKMGGEKTHTLAITEIPSHNHPLSAAQEDSSGRVAVMSHGVGTGIGLVNVIPQSGYSGGGNAHNNLQPYITVYMWCRTA